MNKYRSNQLGPRGKIPQNHQNNRFSMQYNKVINQKTPEQAVAQGPKELDPSSQFIKFNLGIREKARPAPPPPARPPPARPPAPPPAPPVDTSIKKMNIFTKRFTAISAKLLADMLEGLGIKTTVNLRDINNQDIEECERDLNLYLFIYCPQWNLARPGKDIKQLPKNKYFLYQLEQLNQTEQPYQNIDIIINIIKNSYYTFDYSQTNLSYYPEDVRDKVKLLKPLIATPKEYKQEKTIDILFIGLLNERRTKILDEIKRYSREKHLDYKIEIVEKAFEVYLDVLIKKSKIVINLHYYPNAILELFRIHDVLPYDCKIISELPGDGDPDALVEKYKDYVTFFPVVKDDLSNVGLMYSAIDSILNRKIQLSDLTKEMDRMLGSRDVKKTEFIDELNNVNNPIFNEFIISTTDTITSKGDFRKICLYNLDLIKNIIIPNIQLEQYHETFLIEFRKFNHMEYLIRNIIIKLPQWSHTVICGNKNYTFMKEMCNKISPNIKIIRLDIDNLNTAEYSRLLMTKEFWNNFSGEKLLLYQEDSYMFHNRIDEFLEYDWVGAPWPIDQDEHVNQKEYGVGNGGFSLRTKSKMIECIEKVDWEKDLELGPKLKQYMISTNNYVIPEDVYFSKSLLEKNIGKVAPRSMATRFSQETQKSEDPLGGHNYYLSNNKKIFGLIKKRNRIGIYSPCKYTIGGGEYYISMIMKYFIKLKYEIYYFNITNQHIFKKTLKYYLNSECSEYIKLLDPTVLDHNYNNTFDYFIEMGNGKLPRYTNNKFAYKNIYHCQFPYDYNKRWLVPNINYLDCLIVNSEYTKNYYLQCSTHRLESHKIKILYPLCDKDNIDNRDNIKIENSFIMIGRIFPFALGENNKNQNFVMNIFKNFTELNYKLYIVGSSKSDRYLRELKEMAKGKNIEVHADVSEDIKFELLSKSKYYIHAAGADNVAGKIPSSEEHFGISIIEALNCRCIPICANRGYPSFYIKDGVNGILFDNFSDLTEKLRNLLAGNNKLDEDRCIKQNLEIGQKFNIENYESNLSKIVLNI